MFTSVGRFWVLPKTAAFSHPLKRAGIWIGYFSVVSIVPARLVIPLCVHQILISSRCCTGRTCCRNRPDQVKTIQNLFRSRSLSGTGNSWFCRFLPCSRSFTVLFKPVLEGRTRQINPFIYSNKPKNQELIESLFQLKCRNSKWCQLQGQLGGGEKRERRQVPGSRIRFDNVDE